MTIRAEGAGAVAAYTMRDVHMHLPLRAPVTWPHSVGVVPPRAGAFQDRAERARLREAVRGGGTAVLCQVLSGMGGVGKTQLAADLAEELWAEGLDLLVWLSAGSRTAVVAGLAQAGAEVCGADPADPEQASRTFLGWLRAAPRRWLVVLDDLADPSDLKGLWPPAVPHGRTVVTTRRRDAALAGGGRRVVRVGTFTAEEATAYLASVLGEAGRAEPAAELTNLAEDLGCLPLALSQAAAYVVDAGIPVAKYRDLLARRVRTLADVSPDVLPDDQPHTMAAAWELSVERADGLRPQGLARPMLELASFLAPNGIPVAVLTSEPALAYLAAHRAGGDVPPLTQPDGSPRVLLRSMAELQPFVTPDGIRKEDLTGEPALAYLAAHYWGGEDRPPVTPDDAAGALRALHRLSLLRAPGPAADEAEGGGLARVHQVVQRATRDTLPPERHGRTARLLAEALLAVWPDVERDTPLVRALRECTAAVVACTEEGGGDPACLYKPGPHLVLYVVARSLGESGQVAAALAHLRHLASATAEHLGPEHPLTLAACGHLARWQGESGDVAAATATYAGILDAQLRTLGPDHPDTLATRSHLAYFRGEAGDAAGALAEYTALLDDKLRILGPDHPDTLVTRSHLAFFHGEAGDPARAVTEYTALLDDMLRILGPDHPDTLTARGNLAYERAIAGDAVRAVAECAALLEDSLRIYGPDHPRTLTTRSNLAQHLARTGDFAGAAAIHTDLLQHRLRVLGPDHPRTLTTRSNLAHHRGSTGDFAGAAAEYSELLDDMLRILGPDHPHTLMIRSSLAMYRGLAGDAAGAVAGHTELLDDMLRILGPDHPDTRSCRRALARWRILADASQA
ncbi:tetratricopeptide repeat protein [Streptomyces sp. NPDC020983]|uniref:tetratricopeptide repeat protein n=1 Tax=Streptomyces sp. NPDC020983 TaxID=3365106 RepID=UPI0037BDA65D